MAPIAVLERTPWAANEWSRQIFRTCPGIHLDFNASAASPAAFAVARTIAPSPPERPLSVDEVALLSSLTVPASLSPALGQHVPRYQQLLAGLLLDGLVEVHRDGRFQAGAAVVQAQRRAQTEASSEVARVSGLALEYAVAVRHLPVGILAERLYAFNSLPIVPGTQDDGRLNFLNRTGIEADDPSPTIGTHRWTAQPGPAWLHFRRGDPQGGRFKLYLCPCPQDIPRVLQHFAEVIGDRAAGGVFKIAFPYGSLRRPDKIVAYLPTFYELQEILLLLTKLQLEADVQAVPFSAPVLSAPLFSWGVDPPHQSIGLSASWRSWLTVQIAECAHAIPVDKAAEDAREHLSAALSVRDIDSVNWLPSQELLSRKWGLHL